MSLSPPQPPPIQCKSPLLTRPKRFLDRRDSSIDSLEHSHAIHGVESLNKPARIILVRHEQSVGNVDYDVYTHTPDWKVPLTEEGKSHGANVTSAKLKDLVGSDPVYFYTSPYIRTRETCKLIASQLDESQIIGIREEPRIVEQQFGNLQNAKAIVKAKTARRQYGAFFYRFPDGESGLDVYNRVTDFISTLYRDFSNPYIAPPTGQSYNIVVVTHGLTMRLFLMRWFQYSVEEFDLTNNPENGGIVVMERKCISNCVAAADLSPKRFNEPNLPQRYELTTASRESLNYPVAAKPYINGPSLSSHTH